MKTRVVLVAAGAVLISYAMRGVFSEIGVVVFLGAVLVAHDALWMPLVLVAGALLARTGRWTRMVALVVASLGVVALPLVLGFGRPVDNPSVLPLRYGRDFALILLAIALVSLVRAVIRKKFARPREPGDG
ncbi:hypothetical protein ACQPZX_34755 [Actinoplanes sp. CA-142083]|uniref:hypothetical protein n=1 Tax=Actinoplanes sp. CA-142083 TaxID=3239903 RepID=UPI003D9016CF